MTASTLDVSVDQFGTLGVRTQWSELVETSKIMRSIQLGIDQASRNEGVILHDSDLDTDDDD